MKLLRRLLIVLVVLAVLVVGAGFLADGLARSGIEKGGTAALGTTTTLGSADVGFFSGTFSLEDLRVDNPEGFPEEAFLSLGRGWVAVSAATLLSDKVELPALELEGLRVHLVHGLEGSNYGRILDNLERFESKDPGKKEEGKRFVVRRLDLRDVEVAVTPMGGLGFGKVTLPIEHIRLENVGSDTPKGILLAELAAVVVESVLAQASRMECMPDAVGSALQGRLGELELLGLVVDEIKLPGGAGKVLEELGDKVKIPGLGK